MANILIGIIGKDRDAEEVLLKGFKHFFPEVVILLIKKNCLKKRKSIEKNLTKMDIRVHVQEVPDMLHMEDVFMHIRDLTKKHAEDTIVINVDTDYMSSCLALSSAFVSGVQALGILEDQIIAYPIMKFSYYNAINEKKMQILKKLNEKGQVGSMEELSKYTNMSLPLIAYHLKGNRDSKGLVEMSLVQTEKKESSVCVSLTELGKLLANGYIDMNNEK